MIRRHLARMLDYLWLAEDGMKMQVCRRDSCFLSFFACYLLSQGCDTRHSVSQCHRRQSHMQRGAESSQQHYTTLSDLVCLPYAGVQRQPAVGHSVRSAGARSDAARGPAGRQPRTGGVLSGGHPGANHLRPLHLSFAAGQLVQAGSFREATRVCSDCASQRHSLLL